MIVVRKDPPPTNVQLVVDLSQAELIQLDDEREKLSKNFDGCCSDYYPLLWKLTFSLLEKAGSMDKKK